MGVLTKPLWAFTRRENDEPTRFYGERREGGSRRGRVREAFSKRRRRARNGDGRGRGARRPFSLVGHALDRVPETSVRAAAGEGGGGRLQKRRARGRVQEMVGGRFPPSQRQTPGTGHHLGHHGGPGPRR